MNDQSKSIIGVLCIIIPIILSLYIFFDSDILIPNGYELAIDGFVISRTLIFIFILYLVSKLGFFFKKD